MPENNPWPAFKWSPDDKYVARMGKDLVSVYTTLSTPPMKLLGKKSLACPGVKDFSWSPSQNVLCTWSPESPNTPANVTLTEFPSRQVLRHTNLYQVTDVKTIWHPQGHFLCVQVRHPLFSFRPDKRATYHRLPRISLGRAPYR